MATSIDMLREKMETGGGGCFMGSHPYTKTYKQLMTAESRQIGLY